MSFFWEKEDWHLRDRHLIQLERSPFKRQYPELQLTPGVTFIRGPRQIGKSTWMKTILKSLLESTSSVFYYSCDDLSDYKELQELLKSQNDTLYILLDEVTYVKEWWRAIKKRVDEDIHVHILLTGSNAYDLKHGADLLPGRWSKTGEIYLLPMPFDEWREMRQQAGWTQAVFLEDLELYMQVGGFPAALVESGSKRLKIQESLKIYSQWLMGDVIKLKRQELFMKEILLQIAKTTGTPISLHKLAQRTQLMSYHTVQDYLSILEHSFSLTTLYAYNIEKDSFHFKKNKKYYFRDPAVYWLAFDLVGVDPPADFASGLAEQIACEYLTRKYKRLGYYSTTKGEVDFISRRDLAIEIKWSDLPTNLSKAYKDLQVKDKRVWTKRSFFE